MTSSKSPDRPHSKAPWFLRVNKERSALKHEDTYSVVFKNRRPVPRTKANVNLWAASAEMLEEMKGLAKALEDTGHEPPLSFYLTIAKAEGES